MKPHVLIHLITGAAVASLIRVAPAEPPPLDPAPSSSSASTSVSTTVVDGKGKITITVEKDGKTETRTIDLNLDDPGQLAERITEELKHRTDSPDRPKKLKVTYLGVMLAEGPNAPDELGGRRDQGGGPPPVGPASGMGLVITGVSPGSPAEKAGLQGGDVLTKLDDQLLINPAQFTTLVRIKKEGDTVKLTLRRNGEIKELDATLASRDEDQPGEFGMGSGEGVGGLGEMWKGRLLRLNRDGKVQEFGFSGPDASRGPQPPNPPLPPFPPARPDAGSPDHHPSIDQFRPEWEKALREAAEMKDKAASQWQEQMGRWRKQWAETQEKATEDYRRSIEKMSEDIRRANKAAAKAEETARRALDALEQKRARDREARPDRREDRPDQPEKSEEPERPERPDQPASPEKPEKA